MEHEPKSTTVRSRVLVVTNVPAPYRLRLFERVWGDFAHFAVAFQAKSEAGRNWDIAPTLPFPNQYLSGFTIPAIGRRLRLNPGLPRAIKQHDPDVVVVGGFSPMAAVVALLCPRQGRHFVIMNDGTPSTDPVAGLEARYRRWLMSRASGFIAASSSSRQYFLDLGARPDRVATVQLTTDLFAIRRSTSGVEVRNRGRKRWGLGSKVVCFVGQLVSRKRPFEVLDAFEAASREVDDLWLLMAGAGDLGRALHKEVDRRGLDRVRLVGLLGWADLMDLYAASDIHLFPSVREPYGMVVIESLAAGVPIIGTRDCGAAVDLIVEGENGYLVTPGDTEMMARRIQEYFSEVGRATSMRSAARMVVERHDVGIAAKRFSDAIGGAISGTTISGLRRAPLRNERGGIVYVTRTLAPYRVGVFERLTGLGVPTRVIVAGSPLIGVTDATASARAAGVVVERLGSSLPQWRSEVIAACLAGTPDVILIEHGAKLDFAWSLLMSQKLSRTKRILWTHGIESRELYSRMPNLGTIGRWLQLRLADGVLCYDNEMARRMREVFPTKMITAAPNSTDGRRLQAARSVLTLRGKAAVRSELGLTREFYVAALGRLVRDKGFHRLPRILDLVRVTMPDTGLLIMGDGPERARIMRAMERRGLDPVRDVQFLGDVHESDELATWLYCSDVVASAGCIGLAAVDSLFVGIPVALHRPGRKGPFHGPEWKYLRDGPGGLFSSLNTDEGLASAIVDYLRTSTERRRALEDACALYAEDNLGLDPLVQGILGLLPEGASKYIELGRSSREA